MPSPRSTRGPSEAEPVPSPPTRWWRQRWVLAVVLVIALYAVGKVTGVADHVHPDAIRAWVQDAGPWGVLLFFALFTGGILLQIPGLIFVAAAIYLYGRWLGAFVGVAGAVLSLTVSFMVVRAVGGQPLGRVDRPLIRRALRSIDAHPILTVAALRLVFLLAPFLNYVLAMTQIRLRHFVLGSMLGLLVPLSLFAILFDRLQQLWLH